MKKVAINIVASDYVPMIKNGEVIKVEQEMIDLALAQGATEIEPDENDLAWIPGVDAERLGFDFDADTNLVEQLEFMDGSKIKIVDGEPTIVKPE